MTAARLERKQMEWQIEALRVGEGGDGNKGLPVTELLAQMHSRKEPRFSIVLADSVWTDQGHAMHRAKACKKHGIDMVAVSFGGADRDFLKVITSSVEACFFTTLGGARETFNTISHAEPLAESASAGSATVEHRK